MKTSKQNKKHTVNEVIAAQQQQRQQQQQQRSELEFRTELKEATK